MSLNSESAITAIKQAPGPAPWYLPQPASDLSTTREHRTWQRDPKGEPAVLTNEYGQTLAAVTMYSYVSRVSDKLFATWRVDSKREGSLPQSHFNLDLHQVDELRPFDKPPNFALMRQSGKHFLAAAPPIASVQIDRNLSPGIFQTHFPVEFEVCEELFALVSSPWQWDSPELNLWIVHPCESEIEIVPRTWFTSGAYDFGYQWVTRVTRDPVTKNIVGDGIRINGFVLDPEGQSFGSWLDKPTTVLSSK